MSWNANSYNSGPYRGNEAMSTTATLSAMVGAWQNAELPARPQCRSRARLRLVPTRARELRRSYCNWDSGDGGQDLGLALEIAEFINSKKANTCVRTAVSGVRSSWRSDHEKQRWPA
jgi:hypothetical protein